MWFKSSSTIPAVAAISFCFIGGTTPAYADLGDQLFKILADDGEAGDRFGTSVGISGPPGNEIAIVGAWMDDDNGIDSGSAYLFDISDPNNPVQIAKLLPDDGAAGDLFGHSVAISGDAGNEVAIIGAVFNDDNGIDSGSAYLFDAATGQQLAKLVPDDGEAGDNFGESVAINGTTAIIGAPGDDDHGGSAYLFDISDGANPSQIVKLLPEVGAADDFFGFSVAISGTPGNEVAIVGAWGDDDNGSASGSA